MSRLQHDSPADWITDMLIVSGGGWKWGCWVFLFKVKGTARTILNLSAQQTELSLLTEVEAQSSSSFFTDS